MVPVLSLILPIVVSAVIVFVASSVIHMLTPWHKNDFDPLPDEERALETLRSLGVPPGNYGFPKASSMSEMQSPAFQAKARTGPVGFLTIKPRWNVSLGPTLAAWFAFSMAVSTVAGYITGVAFGPGTEYSRIMQVAGCVAFVGYAMAQAHESIWWGRKWSWTLRNMLDGLLYGLLTGGTFGWLWPRA